MTKQEFIEYLRSPKNLKDDEFQELLTIAEDSPYSSVVRSMLATAASASADMGGKKMVATAAIYAVDRRHLKKYVNGEMKESIIHSNRT